MNEANEIVVFVYSEETKDSVIPQNVTHVKVDPSVKEIREKAFHELTSLVEVEFSEGLEKIGREAFAECVKLRHMNQLPSTMKEIGACAFLGCWGLETLVLPLGLKKIGGSAFFACLMLKEIKIPSSSISIDDRVFACCTSLTSIELPEGLEVIGEGWFEGCSALVEIEIPSSVIEIHPHAFSECSKLASLDFPEGLQYIGDMAIQRCRSLTHVAIPETVTSIGECAFRSCHSLTHLRLPSSITKIEVAAFSCCYELISLEFPKGLKDICITRNGSRLAIDGCKSLVNLVVPVSQQVDLDEDLDMMMMERDVMYDLEALAHVSPNFATLVPILQHRFDNKPVHELCYYQSYYPVEETLQSLYQAIHEDPSASILDVDAFGMTPFHILALSQTPMLPLCKMLLDMHNADITATREDKFGNSPMDYLCMNHTPGCTAVIQALLAKAIRKRTLWFGLDRWREEIMTAMDEAIAAEWPLRRQEIEILIDKVAQFERKEAVSLLELAIWRMKIKDVAFSCNVDRQSCRFSSGADVIIPNTLLFLNKAWPVPFKRRRLD